MTIPTLPPRDVLKAQAKRLRSDLAERGTSITHSEALETIAHQWGARDWNTLSARTANAHPGWAPGQRVSGRYLGRPFEGEIKAAQLSSNGYWTVTVRFDQPIDVVTSTLFSNFRRQVSATLTQSGVSVQKTSDGQPQMALFAA